MRNRRVQAPLIVGCLMLFVTAMVACGLGSPRFDRRTKGAIRERLSGFDYEGITHTSWSANQYSTAQGIDSQVALAGTGANWAGLLVTQYQANVRSTSIAPVSWTPTDSTLVAAIAQLHNNGLYVMLKPHVDVLDGAWRGTLNPSDVNAWFASFTNFIVHYAQLAEANGVEMLCFGTELKTMSGSAHRARWNDVIAAIRAWYSGPLSYAANATYPGDEFTSVSFWDQVDVIGLDAYFPLTNHSRPTLSELVNAWYSNRRGENSVAAVLNFAYAHPYQPVIFTEIGYRSLAGANVQPWDSGLVGTADNAEQQNCYEAMYEVWSYQSDWMKGNFWWAWGVAPPGPNDTGYNPRNKPAQDTLQYWQ